MKRILLAGLGVILAGTAWAEAAKPAPASCIDPQKSYLARPLNEHDVYAKQTIGKAKAPVRLKTSCYNIGSAVGIGLSAQFTCVGLGDNVVGTLADGHQQACRVTRVLAYAPEQGDTKQY